MYCIDSELSAFMFNDGQLPVSAIHPIDTRVHRILRCLHVSHTNIGRNIVFWHQGPFSAVHPQGNHSVSNIIVLSCVKGSSRGLEALQSNVNDSYHKSVLYLPEPTINPWTSRIMTKETIPISDHRHTIAQSQYVKGAMGVSDTTGISHSDPWMSP